MNLDETLGLSPQFHRPSSGKRTSLVHSCPNKDTSVDPKLAIRGLLQGGAPKIAKLVNISLISLGLMVDISIVNGIIFQLITWGAPPCREL